MGFGCGYRRSVWGYTWVWCVDVYTQDGKMYACKPGVQEDNAPHANVPIQEVGTLFY